MSVEYPDGWALVNVNGTVVLQLVCAASEPGRLFVSRWHTEWQAYGFGDLPVSVEYVGPGLYRATGESHREYRLPTNRPSDNTFFITVARDLRRGGNAAEWRWDSCHGYWERYYKSGWQRMPRIVVT